MASTGRSKRRTRGDCCFACRNGILLLMNKGRKHLPRQKFHPVSGKGHRGRTDLGAGEQSLAPFVVCGAKGTWRGYHRLNDERPDRMSSLCQTPSRGMVPPKWGRPSARAIKIVVLVRASNLSQHHRGKDCCDERISKTHGNRDSSSRWC